MWASGSPPRRTRRSFAGPSSGHQLKGDSMQELIVDFITSLDGYGAAEGWPGWWGIEGPEYLAWLGERPERDYTILMGANTYRLMYGFAAASDTSDSAEPAEAGVMAELTRLPK